MDQQPSIGRVVHYQSYGTPGGKYLPEPRAALITEVREVPCGVGEDWQKETRTVVSLVVFSPSGQFFDRDIPFAEEPTPGHWNWPPRV